MMLFIPFGHTADEDPAWLNLLTPEYGEYPTDSAPPQGGRPSLREAGDTKLLSSGAQLFPQENSPAAGAAQSAHYRGSLPGNALPVHIHELSRASRESWLNTQLRDLAVGFPGGKKKKKGEGGGNGSGGHKKKKREEEKKSAIASGVVPGHCGTREPDRPPGPPTRAGPSAEGRRRRWHHDRRLCS